MDTKIPKPSATKAPTHSRLPPIARLPTVLPKLPPAVKPMLRRRSKSVCDLRSVVPKTAFFNKIGKIPEKPAPLKVGQKRPALQKSNEENKPKIQKVKIPDWDYKSRFQELQKKNAVVVEELKNLRANASNIPALTQECETLRSNNASLQAQLDQKQQENDTLTQDKENAIKDYMKTFKKLTKIDEAHQKLKESHSKLEHEVVQLRESKLRLDALEVELENLRESHRKLEHEVVQLRQSKLRLDELEVEAENLKTFNMQLRNKVVESDVQRRQLHNTIQDLKGNIRVFCRVRPPLSVESDQQLCAIFCPSESSLEIKKARESVCTIPGRQGESRHDFSFDKVFPPEAKQTDVFEELAPLIQSALDGYHVCVFAYGQTGSGKTFTMQGSAEECGMIPKSIELIFEEISKLNITDWSVTVSASFLEIYNENIIDLLDPNSTQTHELRYNEGRGVTVTNLQNVEISSAHELMDLMEEAHKNRAVAATDFNEHSSRSHAVTKIYLESYNNTTKTRLSGSLNLVDLAGSESAKTSSSERLVETKSINKSLSTLGNVMLALHNKDPHVPYRNSKLTFLLQSCLGGNSKTLMFVNISPLEECYIESINSLRFAAKVKEIKMVAKRNKMYS